MLDEGGEMIGSEKTHGEVKGWWWGSVGTFSSP